ncbi:Uncharacterised protein g8153 [Pycnogonum litorale]
MTAPTDVISVAICLSFVLVSLIAASPYFDEESNERLEEINLNHLKEMNKRYFGKPFPRRRFINTRAMCIRRNHACTFRGKNLCCDGTCRCRFFGSNCYCRGKGLFHRWG